MWNTAGIVLLQSAMKIFGETNVESVRLWNALEYVNVEELGHNRQAGLPSRSLGSTLSQPAFAKLRRGSLRPPLRCGQRLVPRPGLEPGTN